MTGPFGTTPGPWRLYKWDAQGGYDRMTSGIRAGNAKLDGGRYGQTWDEADDHLLDKDRMVADARAIAQVPAMLELVQAMNEGGFEPVKWVEMARAIARQLEKKQ